MADLQTIATAAGVSRRTVARILSDQAPEPIRPFAIERANRVRRIAERYGYRSNAAARAVSTGRFNSLSFVLEGVKETWFSPIMVLGLHDRCEQRGMNLVFTRVSQADVEEEGVMPRVIREASCDGLLMHWLRRLPDEVGQHLARHHVPHIFLNDRREANCIHYDDHRAAENATRHLLELGHRKVAFLTGGLGEEGHYSVVDRLAGYRKTMTAAGLSDAITLQSLPGFYTQNIQPSPIEQLSAWLETPDRPTAVITQSQEYATSLIAAAFRMGLRVPEDLSVMCFSSLVASPIGLELSCLKLPAYELGVQAIDLALNRVDEPQRDFEPVVLLPEIQEGQTVARLRTSS